MSKSGIDTRSGIETRSKSRRANGSQIGDAERIRDGANRRPIRGPATTGTPVVLRPVDKIGDDQEIAREAHLHDRVRSRVEPRRIFRTGDARAPRRPDTDAQDAAQGRPPLRHADGRRARRRREWGIAADGWCRSGTTRSQPARSRRCSRAPPADRRNSAAISAGVSRILLRGEAARRRLSESVLPSAMHTRASARGKSSAVRNWYRTRRDDRHADVLVTERSLVPACTSASSSGWRARCRHLEHVALRKRAAGRRLALKCCRHGRSARTQKATRPCVPSRRTHWSSRCGRDARRDRRPHTSLRVAARSSARTVARAPAHSRSRRSQPAIGSMPRARAAR